MTTAAKYQMDISFMGKQHQESIRYAKFRIQETLHQFPYKKEIPDYVRHNVDTNSQHGMNFFLTYQDNMRPIFWWAITNEYSRRREFMDVLIPYNRETSKQSFQGFKHCMKINKPQWKWLCQQPDTYLWDYFHTTDDNASLRLPDKYVSRMIRERDAPEELRRKNPEGRRRTMPPICLIRPMDNLMRPDAPAPIPELFLDNKDQYEDFRRRLEDLNRWCHHLKPATTDLLFGGLNELLDKYNCPLATFTHELIMLRDTLTMVGIRISPHQRQHRVVKEMFVHKDGINWTNYSKALHRVHDRESARVAKRNEKKLIEEAKETYEEVLADVPIKLTSKCGKYTATLLDSTTKVHQESIDMEHCLYSTYKTRIKNGCYIVYHIDMPELQCGGTAGFISRVGRIQCPDTGNFFLEINWDNDQLQAKNNRFQGHHGQIDISEVDNFMNEIRKILNDVVGFSGQIYEDRWNISSWNDESTPPAKMLEGQISKMVENIILNHSACDMARFSPCGTSVSISIGGGEPLHFMLSGPGGMASMNDLPAHIVMEIMAMDPKHRSGATLIFEKPTNFSAMRLQYQTELLNIRGENSPIYANVTA